jgi:dolichol-phosphate mannosyltransferase
MKMISIVMPALNEEKNIIAAIDNTLVAFDDFSIEGEIIVVNDGSTDSTPGVVMQKMEKDNRIRMLNHDRPKGIGASFWDGVDEARGQFIVMLPGDNENDPWEILQYDKLLNFVDMIIPFVFNKQARSLFRNVLSFLYRFIINTTFLVNINYTNGTVLYRKSLLQELDFRSNGFFFQTDILIRLVKKGYLFAEVPYKLGVRNRGISKAVSFPSLIQVIKGYFRLVGDIYYNNKNEKPVYHKDSITFVRRK